MTFVVQQVFKDQTQNSFLKPRSQVRLYFKRKPSSAANNLVNSSPSSNSPPIITTAITSGGSIGGGGGGGGSAANIRCIQKYAYATINKKAGELVKANIKRGRRYIVFVNGIGPHNYTILGEPIAKTKKNTKAVLNVLCKNCGKSFYFFIFLYPKYSFWNF